MIKEMIKKEVGIIELNWDNKKQTEKELGVKLTRKLNNKFLFLVFKKDFFMKVSKYKNGRW